MYPVLFLIGLIILYGTLFRVNEIPKRIQENSKISNMVIPIDDVAKLYDRFIGKYFTEEEVELARRYKFRTNIIPWCYMPFYETGCTYDEQTAEGYINWKLKELNKLPMEMILAENNRRDNPTRQMVNYLKNQIDGHRKNFDDIPPSKEYQDWTKKADKELFLIDIIGADNYNGLFKHMVLYDNPYPKDKKKEDKNSGWLAASEGIFFKPATKIKTQADGLSARVSEKLSIYLELCMNNYDRGYWKFNPLPPIMARDFVFAQIQQITEPRLRKVSHEGEQDEHFAMRKKIKAKCKELGLMEMHEYATPRKELDPSNMLDVVNNMFVPESRLQEPWKLDENNYGPPDLVNISLFRY